jgi:hypothetical protein
VARLVGYFDSEKGDRRVYEEKEEEEESDLKSMHSKKRNRLFLDSKSVLSQPLIGQY